MTKRSDHYHWNDSPALQDMTIETGHGGKLWAVLYAPEDTASHEKLAALQETLIRDHGIYSYAQNIEGKPALIAKNFGKPEHLLEALQSTGVVAGTPTVQEVKDPNAKPMTFSDRFDEFRHTHGMRVYAGLGMMGHLTQAVFLGLPKEITRKFGFEGEGNTDNLRQAALNILNCSLYLWKGNGDRGLQTDPVLQKLHGMFAENGIDLANTSVEDTIKHYESNKPFAKKLDDFISDNLMWFTEGIGIVNNVQTGMAGLKDQDYGRFILSASALLGSTYATAVKEIPMKEQPPEKLASPLGKAQAIAQSSPFFVNTLSNIVGTVALPMDSWRRYNLIKNRPVDFQETENGQVTNLSMRYKEKAGLDLEKARGEFEQAWNKQQGLSIDADPDKLRFNNGVDVDISASNANINKLRSNVSVAENAVKLGNNQDIVWQAHSAMSTFYLLCNLASIFCSKNAAEDKDPFMKYEELLARTAQMVTQAETGVERERVISMAATGLAAMHDQVRGVKANDIADHLKQLVQEIEHNPFVSKTTPHQSQTQGKQAKEELHEEFARIRDASGITPPATTIDATNEVMHTPMTQAMPSLTVH